MEGASSAYDVAMIENPKLSLDLSFLVRKSRAGRELGDVELSKALLRRAQSLATSGKDIGQTNWILGLDAFFVKDYESAKRFFAQVFMTDPAPPLELLYYSGWALYKMGNYDEASNAFHNLEDLNQGQFDPGELNLLQASIAYHKADLDEAQKRLADTAAYPRDIRNREEALYLAAYVSLRMDSLSQSTGYAEKFDDTVRSILIRARLALENGSFPEACELYSRLESQEALYGLAVSQYLASRTNEAEKTALEYLDAYPGGAETEQTFLLLAMIERGRNRYDKAIEYLNRGLSINSRNRPRLLYDLAEIEYSVKHYSKANEACVEILTEYPLYTGKDMVNLLLARGLFYSGETDSTIKVLNELAGSTSDEVVLNEIHYYLGESYYRKGDYSKSAEEFKNVSPGSSYFKALKRRGEVLAAAGRNFESVESFLLAYSEAPSLVEKESVLLAIEERRLAMGRYSDKASMLKSFLEKYPDASIASGIQLQIALDYFERRNWTFALHEFNKVLDKYPDSDAAAEALYYKARCQRNLGKTDDALKTYSSIPPRFPSSAVVSRSQTELANMLLSLGRPGEALSVYRDLLSSTKSSSERASYTLKMAEIYCGMGNLQTASDLVTAALTENPPSDVAKRLLLFGMRVELSKGSITSAVNYSVRYRNRFGETPEYLLGKGDIDKASGNLKDALSSYREAASRLPERSESRIEALLGAASTAELLGGVDEAKRYLEQAAIEVQLDRQRVEITKRLQTLK